MKIYRAFHQVGMIEITSDDEIRLDKLHQMVNNLTPDEAKIAEVYVRHLLLTRPSKG